MGAGGGGCCLGRFLDLGYWIDVRYYVMLSTFLCLLQL